MVQLCYRVFRMQDRPGLITGIFLAGYGLARISMEFFRDSESMIYGWFSMGMALSLFMWLASAWFVWRALRKPQRKDT